MTFIFSTLVPGNNFRISLLVDSEIAMILSECLTAKSVKKFSRRKSFLGKWSGKNLKARSWIVTTVLVFLERKNGSECIGMKRISGFSSHISQAKRVCVHQNGNGFSMIS